MYSLDKHQVALIEADVENARITLENLSQELVDHICCEVENQMIKGKSFEEAYSIIKEQTGIQVLQRIQENTLYLIDKKYAIMKTTMKITGNISLALLAVGTLIKINHWPGASITLVLGFALLCLIFFPAAIYTNYREGNTNGRILLNTSILFGGIALMVGILFKVMHWQGASALMLIGWMLILLIFLPSLLFVKLKETSTNRGKGVYILGVISLIIFELGAMFKMFHWQGAALLLLLGSVLLIGFFLPFFTYAKFKEGTLIVGQFIFLIIISIYAVVLTSLLALNVSKDILVRFVNEESNSAKIVHYFEKKKEQHPPIIILKSDSLHLQGEKQISAIIEEASKLQNLIVNIKLELIQASEQVNKQTAMEYIINPILINGKDNSNVVNSILIGNGLSKSLKETLAIYREKARMAAISDSAFSRQIELLLSTAEKENQSWEEVYFRNQSLISTVAILTTIEQNVRMVESGVIKHIQQKQ